MTNFEIEEVEMPEYLKGTETEAYAKRNGLQTVLRQAPELTGITYLAAEIASDIHEKIGKYILTIQDLSWGSNDPDTTAQELILEKSKIIAQEVIDDFIDNQPDNWNRLLESEKQKN